MTNNLRFILSTWNILCTTLALLVSVVLIIVFELNIWYILAGFIVFKLLIMYQLILFPFADRFFRNQLINQALKKLARFKPITINEFYGLHSKTESILKHLMCDGYYFQTRGSLEDISTQVQLYLVQDLRCEISVLEAKSLHFIDVGARSRRRPFLYSVAILESKKVPGHFCVRCKIDYGAAKDEP